MDTRTEDLKRQLGALWKTALFGLDAVKDVVVRSSQSGRLRVDIALLHNQRSQLLQQLGEAAIDLVEQRGPDQFPSLTALYDQIKDVEGRIHTDTVRATDNAFGAPRGYEPEAAADYGDIDGDTMPADPVNAAPSDHPTPPTPRPKRRSPKRKDKTK